MFGIGWVLKRLWNNRDRVKQAMEQDLFPPARCLICGRPWRYGSDEQGKEWVECDAGHHLTKPDFDKSKARPPILNSGVDNHGDI